MLDAFTSGGAQQAGGNHATTLDAASDLDYVVGRHSLRTGFVFDATHYRSDATSNYLGTYTFDSLAAYEANQPSNYTRRIGDPSIVYDNVQAGVYVQDDIRVRKNLSLTPGLRYEVQSHVGDRANVGPRFGFTWAPTTSGQTTIRGSAGIFYDWLPTSTYDQVVRLDGFHQQEINVVDPSFPVDENTASVPPVNRYALSPNYDAPRITRFSTGIDQTIRKVSRVSVTYSYLRGSRLARGLNVNPAIDGVRADPRFANVIDVVSDAASRQHELRFDASINPGAMLPVARVRTAHQLEAHDRVCELHAVVAAEQHRRPVQPAADRHARDRVGTGQRRERLFRHEHPGTDCLRRRTDDGRRAAPRQCERQQPGGAQRRAVTRRQREQRAAVHAPHWRRTTTVTAFSTIAPPASAATRCERAGR